MLWNAQFLQSEKTFHSSSLWILLSLKKEKKMHIHIQCKSACIQVIFYFLTEKCKIREPQTGSGWKEHTGSHLGPTSQAGSSWSTWHRIVSKCFLNISQEGEYTESTAIHSSAQSPSQVKKFFLIFR